MNGTYIGVCKDAITVYFQDSPGNSDKSYKNVTVADSSARVSTVLSPKNKSRTLMIQT
jgi:hypothetical protein